MSSGINLSCLDAFFISYDEPNCEENWSNLLTKVPWAKRVHGIYGSDAAHKECARRSETERFVSIDADNIIDSSIFDQIIYPDDVGQVTLDNRVFSWCGINHINNLKYGNGGIKCWPVDVVLNMKTHELAEDEKSQVDFCWDINYVQIERAFSYIYNNSTPYQAYRAGFREGVKMSLDKGIKIDPMKMEELIWPKNFNRLLIWNTVGADVENGLWAIYGARLGTYMTNLSDWDYRLVRDFNWHDEFWALEVSPKFKGDEEKCFKSKYAWSKTKLLSEIKDLGNKLRKVLNLEISDLDPDQSRFLKRLNINPPRLGDLEDHRTPQWAKMYNKV